MTEKVLNVSSDENPQGKSSAASMEEKIALKEHELLRILMDNVPDSIYFKDHEGRFVMVNKAKAYNSSTTPEAMIGKTDFDYLSPAQASRVRQLEEEIIKTGKPMVGNVETLTRKSGNTVHVLANKVPWYDSEGNIIGTIGISRDITEFKDAREALELAKNDLEKRIDERTHQLKELNDTLLAEINERKRMEEEIRKNYYTQRAINNVLKIALEPVSLTEQLDKTLDLVLSIPWLSLLSKGSIFSYDDATSSLNMISVRGLSDFLRQTCKTVPVGMCLCGRCALTRETIFVNHLDDRHDIGYDGMTNHGHYCVPIQKGSQLLGVINLYVNAGHTTTHMEVAFLLAVADSIAGMMERDKNELEKHKLQKQLIHSEKLSALGRLSASVAHEIRNPLTAIGGFARRLHKMVLDGTKEKEYADVISAESTRLEIILKNILSYSRAESHNMSSQNLNEIIAETIRNYSETMVEKCVKVFFTAGNLPLIKVDRTQIRQVFDNLVTNAIDAMPSEGGSVRIITKATVKDNVKCAMIQIEDSGTGIPADKISMIFEPFFSTKEMGRGTGLGLPITRRIVTEHGGMINVESYPGAGSVFTVYLPFKE
ncbi:MAG: PAS domain-containing protein [Nitrospirae bacterium]|nr:PAS domain-containing protein [Nitrospirota bacterium]MBF0536391.1 PAS domain-containing protein [Nitrospirota bacterium]MBF0618179.1 PAS domain-containing protein [Nitrospirota bacterium]